MPHNAPPTKVGQARTPNPNPALTLTLTLTADLSLRVRAWQEVAFHENPTTPYADDKEDDEMAEVAGMEAREWLNGRAEGYGKCGAAAARVAGRFFCDFSKICSDNPI